ncbi:hypothetical protein IAR50_004969 [Cryptococcus sp. DSM 104548]
MPTLPILCFNDVYRVQQKYNPQPGAPEDNSPDQNITVSQFAELLLTERSKWADKSTLAQDGEKEKEGLVLFAGDVFSPSVESSVTRGSHMVPILNAIKVDAACVGNHDFDSGYPHLTKLIQSTTFPWMLSNIVDIETGVQPETLQRYQIFERCGVKIGVIGLVEQDWIATIPSWPHNFKYRSMTETALELSKELRDPNGEHQVDIIIALTHCRVPNDITLANELGAVAGKAGLENEHGLDLIIGGHDHIGQGSKSWEGYSGRKGAPGTQEDTSCLIMKNGTDFRDLTSASLELTPSPPGSIRKHLITSLTGKHHYVLPSSPSSPAFEQLVKSLLSSVSEALQKPVCFTLAPFDARSEVVRVEESGLGNWIADVLMHAFAESNIEKKDQGGEGGRLEEDEGPGADAAIICGGTLRGDSQYGPGKITIGDILEILPFDDPVVCIEIDGAGIWSTLEAALSKWPAQEGRFPIVSGLAVKWDHKRPPNNRVISIHQLVQPTRTTEDDWEDPEDMVDFREQEDGTRVIVKNRKLKLGEEVKNVKSEEGGRMYKVITRDYMAQGYDGFEPLKNRKFIVDDENGQIMSSILRSFLLGSAYIFRHKQLEEAAHSHLSRRTSQVLSRARAQHQSHSSPSVSVSSSPKREFLSPPSLHSQTRSSPNGDTGGYLTAGSLNAQALSPGSDISSSSGWGLLKRHVVDHDWGTIRNALHVARHEHMSGIDSVAGQAMRQAGHHMPGAWSPVEAPTEEQTSDPAAGVALDDGDDDITIQDLAIVCPLIDGRMRDVSAGKD